MSRHEARRTRRLQAGCLSSRSRSTQTVADPLLAMNRALPPAGGGRQDRDIRGSCSGGTNILRPDAFCPRLRDDSPAGHVPSVLGLACRQASEDQLADTAAPIPRIAIHRPGAESPQGCQGEFARSLSYLGRLPSSGASRRHLGRPDSCQRSCTDHFSPCEPDPTSSDSNSLSQPVSAFLFPFQFPRGLVSGAAKSSQLYGNCHSRSIPCSSESNYADICMAIKEFAIVDQLSKPLRARTQPKRCQYFDSALGPGRGWLAYSSAALLLAIRFAAGGLPVRHTEGGIPPGLRVNHARGKTWRHRERRLRNRYRRRPRPCGRWAGWVPVFSAKVIYSPQKVPWQRKRRIRLPRLPVLSSANRCARPDNRLGGLHSSIWLHTVASFFPGFAPHR